MPSENIMDIKNLWNELADDWSIQVGSEGDGNRRFNSDPVLWNYAGDVEGLKVLDAGCGTGYLSVKLREKGANVTGIDISERAIEIAKSANPDIDFKVGSVSELQYMQSDYFDLIVSNYVLMDTPDLEKTIDAFYRVLKRDGHVILIFSHPCFPQAKAEYVHKSGTIAYTWDFPYFERSKQISPPWGHFKKDFIWFHRPLSDYWKVFKTAGFRVVEFDEPRVTSDNYALVSDQNTLKDYQTRPYSVAFKLQKNR